MKMTWILSILVLSSIVKAAEMSTVIFDEDFGYTNTVFESGYYQGKCFKDIKAKAIDPQILSPNETSSMPAITTSMFDAVFYVYSYKINPANVASQFYRRYHSINVSRKIMQEHQNNIPKEPSPQEMYYIITGKKLLPYNDLYQKTQEEVDYWYQTQCERYHKILFTCAPISFFESLEAITKDQDNEQDPFKIIDCQNDILDFQNARIDFTSWKNSIPENYKQILSNDAALRCYYIYLYNHSIIISNEFQNKLTKDINLMCDITELEAFNEILCPYPKYHAYYESGYKEPEDHPVYKKLFGNFHPF